MCAKIRHPHYTTWSRWLCDSVSVSSYLSCCYGAFSFTFLFGNGASHDVVLIIFGFLLNCCLVMFAVVSSCYILYHICWLAICRIQTYCTFIECSPSSSCQYLRARMCQVLLQLVDSLSDDIPQQRKDGRRYMRPSDSSELEDIEPDYRDRETKLYDALVNSPQKTGKDTFEPFPY